MPLTPRDRRTLIVGGVILVAMMGAFLLFNLTQSEEGAIPSFPPINPSGTTATTPPSTGPTGSITTTPTPTPSGPTSQSFTGRDPFSIPAVLSSSEATSPTSVSSGPTSTTTGTTTSTPTSPTTTTSPTTPGGGSSIVIGGHTVVLLDTEPSNSRVQVEVDAKVYNVRVGHTFAAGQFELRSINGNCATFLFGDQSFTLCATSPK